MKRISLFLLIVLVQLSRLSAAPIDENQALNIAERFLNQTERKSLVKGKSADSYLTLAYTCKEENTTKDSFPYYYIFNRSDNNGFIIISGDDRTKEVLGYSDNGLYDPDNLPDNFKAWMEYYKEEIKHLSLEQNKQIDISSIQESQNSYADFIEPLLEGIAWNQNSPYNNLCPMQKNSRTYTGCVATAMAQIMRYHKWPARGQGINTYTPPQLDEELTVDFSESVYDWENMTETYNSSSTDEEKAAVAKLMYDCGVSVNMQYTSSASGAYATDIPNALRTYFNYDENLQLHYREYYTLAEWTDMIKNELNHKRPIHYAGQNNSAGHAFVCDGYDTNGLFHINWGWGGMSNGYFEISVLDPGQQGIGGSSAGYNMAQSIITGIRPPANSSQPTYIITLETDLTIEEGNIERDQKIIINKTNIYNKGSNPFNGEIAFGLFQNNELIEIYEVHSVQLNAFRGVNVEWEGFEIDPKIEDGNYQLRAIHKLEDGEWKVNQKPNVIQDQLDVIITNDKITFSSPAHIFIPDGGVYVVTDAITGMETVFRYTIENPGKEVHCILTLFLQNKENRRQYQTLTEETFYIRENETISAELASILNVPAGEYYLYVGYTNSPYIYGFDGESIITVIVEEPGEAPVFSLEKELELNQLTLSQGETATLTTSITNTGGKYNNSLYATVYRATSSIITSNILEQIPLIVDIDSDETQEIVFTKEINYSAGNYYIRLSYRNQSNNIVNISDDKNRIDFTVTTASTNIDNTIQDQIIIYPSPAEDMIHVQQNATIRSLSITDISGKLLKPCPVNNISDEIVIPVSTLNPGIYLLKISTDKGLIIKKFIKK